MTHWIASTYQANAYDIEVLEELALAMAQATIQNAIDKAGVSKSEIARRMNCDRSFVSRILSGNHNLTVKTMARSLAACGFEVRFQPVQIEWNWVSLPPRKEVPANTAGTAIPPMLGLGA